jgi:hypothetical protein
MAALTCRCGNRLSDTESPNEIQYHVYSDKEWDQILRNDTIEMYQFPRPDRDVWRCNNCERLYVFNSEGVVVKVYLLESRT